MRRLQVPQVPPCFAQRLHDEQFLQALQGFAPVQVAAAAGRANPISNPEIVPSRTLRRVSRIICSFGGTMEVESAACQGEATHRAQDALHDPSVYFQQRTPPCDEHAPLPVALLDVPSLHVAPVRVPEGTVGVVGVVGFVGVGAVTVTVAAMNRSTRVSLETVTVRVVVSNPDRVTTSVIEPVIPPNEKYPLPSVTVDRPL